MFLPIYTTLFLFGTALHYSVALSCENNKQCRDGQYCAANECIDYMNCKKDVDCYNPSNKFISIMCLGHFSCEMGGCKKVCETCKDGSDVTPCVVKPCEVNECDGTSKCADDYCGGCNSIHFDKAGNDICRLAADDTKCPAKECNKALRKNIKKLEEKIQNIEKYNRRQQEDIDELKATLIDAN